MSAPGRDVDLATARLLWSACRRHPDPGDVHRVLEAGADGPRAAELAGRHRIAGLLHRALDHAGALEALGSRQETLSDLAEVQRFRELLLVPEVLRLSVRPLADDGLEPVVLKGPAVSARYPAPGTRSFDDIDLLVPKARHTRALAVLQKNGWTVIRTAARDRYDSTLVHDALPGFPVELHYGLDAWYDRASSLRADELWAKRVPVEIAGQPAFGLPVVEELVMLCAHAAKPFHGFSRLMWIADLAMVVGAADERGSGIDWDAVDDLARRSRCSTAVAAALSLAAHAGASSPASLRALPANGWRAEALTRLVDERWPLAPSTPIHLRFALAENTGRRLQLLVGYTHGMRGFKGVSWYVHNADQAVRRWRDLQRSGLGQADQAGEHRHP